MFWINKNKEYLINPEGIELVDYNELSETIEKNKINMKKIDIKLITIWDKINLLFQDSIMYDLESLPKGVRMDNILYSFKKTKILLYDSHPANINIRPNKPNIIHRGLFSFRPIKIIDSNQLSKEQLNKLLSK